MGYKKAWGLDKPHITGSILSSASKELCDLRQAALSLLSLGFLICEMSLLSWSYCEDKENDPTNYPAHSNLIKCKSCPFTSHPPSKI